MKIKLREPINSLTHLSGAALSVIGLFFLLSSAIKTGETIKIVSSVIFALGLIGLYTTSGIYHGAFKHVKLLRKLDHTMIYVLIAATYTPICLVSLKGWIGTSMIITIWSLAVVGGILKFLWINAPRWLYTSFYLILGWAALILLYPLAHRLPFMAIFLLFAGGILYSVGAVIYAKKPASLKIGVYGFHEIFHLFILLGSLSHFVMIYRYVIIN